MALAAINPTHLKAWKRLESLFEKEKYKSIKINGSSKFFKKNYKKCPW